MIDLGFLFYITKTYHSKDGLRLVIQHSNDYYSTLCSLIVSNHKTLDFYYSISHAEIQQHYKLHFILKHVYQNLKPQKDQAKMPDL